MTCVASLLLGLINNNNNEVDFVHKIHMRSVNIERSIIFLEIMCVQIHSCAHVTYQLSVGTVYQSVLFYLKRINGEKDNMIRNFYDFANSI